MRRTNDDLRHYLRVALECAAFVACFAAALGAGTWVEVLL